MTKQQTIAAATVGAVVAVSTGVALLRSPSPSTVSSASASAAPSKRLSAPPMVREVPDEPIANACARLVALKCEEGTHLDCATWLPRVIADHAFSVSPSDKTYPPLLTAECITHAADVTAVRACGKAITCKLPEIK